MSSMRSITGHQSPALEANRPLILQYYVNVDGRESVSFKLNIKAINQRFYRCYLRHFYIKFPLATLEHELKV